MPLPPGRYGHNKQAAHTKRWAGQRARRCTAVAEATYTDPIFEKVDEALNRIRPALLMDGGNVELVAVEDGIAKVRMVGACGG